MRFLEKDKLLELLLDAFFASESEKIMVAFAIGLFNNLAKILTTD
jgi:hypothetical protein